MEEKWFERTLAVLGFIALCVLIYLGFTAGKASAATVCQIANGCTGTSTSPAYGKVLVGGQSGEYEFVSTSTFGSAGAGTVTSVGLSSPNSTITVGSTPVTTSGTITADFNLGHSNWWTALQNFANATSSGFEATSSNVFFDGFTSVLLSVNASHQVTAYVGSSCTNQFIRSLNGAGVATCGTVQNSDLAHSTIVVNGTTLTLGDTSDTIAAASSTLLSDNNTFSGHNTITNASTTNLTASSYLGINGTLTANETLPATSTSITLNWGATGPQLDYQIGTAATTITIINATTSLQAGSRKVVWICNPNTTAGALTWGGIEWIGTAPTQTTTSNECDVYSFDVSEATSTSGTYKIAGTQGAGFQ